MWSLVLSPLCSICRGRYVKRHHSYSRQSTTIPASPQATEWIWDLDMKLASQRSTVDHPWFRIGVGADVPSPQRPLLHPSPFPARQYEPAHRHLTWHNLTDLPISPLRPRPSPTSSSFCAHGYARVYCCAIQLRWGRTPHRRPECLRVNTSSRR